MNKSWPFLHIWPFFSRFIGQCEFIEIFICLLKGTVSRELRPMLLNIIKKLFSRPIIAGHKIYIHNHQKTLQHKLSWLMLLCLNHVAGGIYFFSPGCDMYTFVGVGGRFLIRLVLITSR